MREKESGHVMKSTETGVKCIGTQNWRVKNRFKKKKKSYGKGYILGETTYQTTVVGFDIKSDS